jgi:hypothetical protein
VVFALLVCCELAPQVVWFLVLWVLEIVLSIGACLPDVNDGAWDALLRVEILHHTVHERSLTIGVSITNNGVAKVAEWGVR